MLTYRVTYAHDNYDALVDSEKHGYAMQEVTVDREVTTQEQIIEIARAIGIEHGYTSVGIIKTELRIDEEEE